MQELRDLIQSRRSVRTFDGKPLKAEDRALLEQHVQGITNPFGVPIRFVFLDAKEHGLSSPVITGESLYIAGIVENVPNADAAFGFAFEDLVLFAWSMGIGTTWIGGTMKRELFEKAAGLNEGEHMPCVSPLGYPAKKFSIKEALMRRGVGADSRLPLEEIFFDGSWGTPLSFTGQDALKAAAEMVRRAPSAVNKQPWRIIAAGSDYHFYKKANRGYNGAKTGDLQKVDVGIALYHFFLGIEALGAPPEILVSDPGLSVPEDAEYIATVRVPQGRARA